MLTDAEAFSQALVALARLRDELTRITESSYSLFARARLIGLSERIGRERDLFMRHVPGAQPEVPPGRAPVAEE